ncbi:MAG: hypothetical protein KBH45_19050 [Verrucomicrobia bacterium]|nr:hypothetical protein [Verrucomicrobiota bacterium]
MKRLLTLAEKARDRFTQNSLQWFIREQLEEATSMDVLLQIGRRTGGGGRLFVEHFLGAEADAAGGEQD